MGMVCFVVFPLSFCLLVGAYCIHHAYFGAMCTLVPCALWCILSHTQVGDLVKTIFLHNFLCI